MVCTQMNFGRKGCMGLQATRPAGSPPPSPGRNSGGWSLWPALLAAAALSVLACGASAQEADGPLRYLKPWLEAPAVTPDASLAPQVPAAQPAEPAATGATGAGAEGAGEPETPPPDAGLAAPPVPTLPPPPPALRLAVLAGRDAGALLRAIAPLVDGLSDALGRRVEVVPMSTFAAIIDAQASERIDGGFYSATAYALAQARCACLQPLAAPAAEDGDVAYHAIVVVRRGSGLRSLADLKGKRVAAGPADSIAARRMQVAGLDGEAEGAAALGALIDAGSADDAVLQVASGAADAAFAWSSLAGDQALGYSRGTLTGLVGSGAVAMDALEILWRSPAITHGPVAVRRSLPDEEKQKIASYLMVLDEAAPAAYDALNPSYGGGYVEVGEAAYRGVEAMAAGETGE